MSSSLPNPIVPESTESKRSCIGRTPTFKRCSNPPGPNKRFCRHHRYQIWAFPLFLITTSSAFLGLYLSVIQILLDDAIEQQLAQIVETAKELGAELDKEKERSRQLFGGVQSTARWADSVAETDPKIKALADSLEALIAEFEAKLALENLSDVDDLRFRLSKATLANAQQRHAEVPTLLPVDEAVSEYQAAKKQSHRAEIQTNRAIEVNQALGDGFYGLQEWQKARACYKRILDLNPDRWDIRFDVANCLLTLGQLSAASNQFDEIVAHFTTLVEQEGRIDLANDLADALNNRGITFRRLRNFDDAIKYYDRAIKIYARLADQETGVERAIDLARSLNNRGITLESHGKYGDGIKDHDEAIEIFTRLVEQEGRTELAVDLARSRNIRGSTLHAQGKLNGAHRDFDRAIEILAFLVEQKGRTELENHLAMALNNRGETSQRMGNLDQAIKDCDKAVEIYTRLVEQRGRTELAAKLAASFESRGGTLRALGRLGEAIQDYNRSIEIFARLIEQEGRTELLDHLFVPLVARGLALVQQGKSREAIDDFSEAVGILEQLVSEGRSQLEGKLQRTRQHLADLKNQEPGE